MFCLCKQLVKSSSSRCGALTARVKNNPGMIETQPTQYFSPQPKVPELDLELLGFTAYAAARWRVIAMASVAAVTIVLLVSLMLPKKYTAFRQYPD